MMLEIRPLGDVKFYLMRRAFPPFLFCGAIDTEPERQAKPDRL
jgi:hypothetical protein